MRLLTPRSWLRAGGALALAAAAALAVGDTRAEADEPSMGRPDAGALSRTPPDPRPLRSSEQYVVDLRWVRGDVYLVSMNVVTLPAPRESPRVMGRFALELYEGATLLDRVRFDFPLLGAVEGERGAKLAPKLSTRVGVMFPAISRGTHLELWDRATDTRWPVPWPPATPAPLAPADAGGPAPTRANKEPR
ncbi:MAG TPA: hypothetical protein PK141_28500 [Polyangiaceae bacterium]|nr:hypothetical protein [Polyangiaceae bacterium]